MNQRDKDIIKTHFGLDFPDEPTIRLNTGYNINGNAWSERSALHCKDKTLAQQQFKDECDINVLFSRYLETGEIPQVMDGLTYGNFEGVFDFQSAMNAVRTAEGLFSQLPARIKNRFDNDPQKMLDFLHDPENRDEAEFLGLIKQEPDDAPRTTTPAEGEPQTQQGTVGTQQATGPDQKTKTT